MTVVGTPGTGTPVTDRDLSHYFGVVVGLSIEKATNGFDADTPPGPLLRPGSLVTWSYVVTNNSNVAIEGINVSDDQVGPVACPQTTLTAGESMTCTPVTGVVLPGQYVNLATVTGVTVLPGEVPNGATVTALALQELVSSSEPSHYFGAIAGIDIEKVRCGQAEGCDRRRDPRWWSWVSAPSRLQFGSVSTKRANPRSHIGHPRLTDRDPQIRPRRGGGPPRREYGSRPLQPLSRRPGPLFLPRTRPWG